MKKRDPHPYRPAEQRMAPSSEYAELMEAVRRARSAITDPRASVAIVVSRVTADGRAVALHSAVGLGGEETGARLVKDGPGSLDEFLERKFRGGDGGARG